MRKCQIWNITLQVLTLNVGKNAKMYLATSDYSHEPWF